VQGVNDVPNPATNRRAQFTAGRGATMTFKPRRRSMSPARQLRFAAWIRQWGLPVDGAVVDFDAIFGRSPGAGNVILDIGVGHGESTLWCATDRPDVDLVAVEVHTPGVATIFETIERAGLRNIRVVHGDALSFITRIAEETLAGVQIYFPDPWPKPRQHHRRIVNEQVVSMLTDRLRPGGTLALATDVDNYAQAMVAACAADDRLRGGVVERPSERVITRFEQRALTQGRSVVDLAYERIG
jgi:tRNA (guanine-N7-)-methyltransferase